MLAAMVAAAGGEPWLLPIARDTAKSLDAALARAATADLLLITGGVSAGKFDLVEPALARAGASFHFTGVRIQPGKPLVFAELRSPRPHRPKPERHNSAASAFPATRSHPQSHFCSLALRCSPQLAAAANSALASHSRDWWKMSKRSPALPVFCRQRVPSPIRCPRSNWFRGKGRETWPPWPGQTVFWWCPKNPTIFTRAISSAFFLSEEFHAQTPFASFRILIRRARPIWSTSSGKQATRRTATASAFVELSSSRSSGSARQSQGQSA